MLAILTTHPIQYQVPIWRLLASRDKVPFKVFFLSRQGLLAQHDPGFGKALSWDIDLLGGYPHEFLPAIEGPRQDSMLWLRLGCEFGAILKQSGATQLWVQGWQVAAYWQAIHQARSMGIPVWLRGESNLRSSAQGVRSALKAPLLSWLFSQIDHFLCIGKANREFYLARKVPQSKLADAPYCIDNARFAERAETKRAERGRLRAEWGVPSDAICILFVGKLIQKKRPLDLIAACRRALSMRPDLKFHLLFAGSGELAEAVRASCRIILDTQETNPMLKARDTEAPPASFLGFVNQSQLPKVYAAADCLVLPSEATETWGLVVNEAMASGVPALVSDAVGCGEDLVRPIDPELVFPLGDIEAQARSLIRMADFRPTADVLASRIDRFDPLRTVETVERLYREGI